MPTAMVLATLASLETLSRAVVRASRIICLFCSRHDCIYLLNVYCYVDIPESIQIA